MERISPQELKEMAETSLGVQLIITGLARLVEEEGFTPREALLIAKYTGEHSFFALHELKKENE